MKVFKRYSYTGPTYFCGNKISQSSNLFTQARSFEEARRNFIFKIANGDITNRYDIVDEYIVLVDNFDSEKAARPRCEICGYELNDNNECPVCDYGEYDLLD